MRTIPSWEGGVAFVISMPLWTTWEGGLHEGLPSHHRTPSLGDVLERIREREGLSFPGRTYKMLKNPCMGLQEETGRRAMTDPQSNVSKIGGPLLNAGLMATNLPGILSPLAGPILSLHRNRDWGLIQATATYSPSTFFCGLSCLLPNLPAFVPTLPLHTHQSALSATSPQEWTRRADQKPRIQTNKFSSASQSEEMINTGRKILIWNAWAQKWSRFWKVLLWNIHPDLLVKHFYLIKTNKQAKHNNNKTQMVSQMVPKLKLFFRIKSGLSFGFQKYGDLGLSWCSTSLRFKKKYPFPYKGFFCTESVVLT